MPEHANLSVATHSSMGMLKRFVHRKVLVIGCHDLCHSSILMVKAFEVLQDVNESFFLEDTIEECLVVSNLRRLALTVHALPFHITVSLGCDGAGLCGQHVAGQVEGIIHKQRRTFLLILFDLRVGILFVRFFTRW